MPKPSCKAFSVVLTVLATVLEVNAQTVQGGAASQDNDKTFTTLTGLKIADDTVGLGSSPLAGQLVTVNYRSWVYSNAGKGEVFINSGKPLEFAYAKGQVPPELDESLATMKVGGKRTVIVPGQVGLSTVPEFEIGFHDGRHIGSKPSTRPIRVPGFIFEAELLSIR